MASCPTNGNGAELLSSQGNPREKPSLATADVYLVNNPGETFELSETSAAPNGSRIRHGEESSSLQEGSAGILNDLNAVSPSIARVVGMNVLGDDKFADLKAERFNGGNQTVGECDFITSDFPQSQADDEHDDPRQSLAHFSTEENAIPNGFDKSASEDSSNADFNSNFHVNGPPDVDETQSLTNPQRDLEGQVPAKLDFRENYFQPDKYSSQSSSMSSVAMGTGDHGNGCYCNASGNDSSSALHYSDQSSVSSEIICHSPMCSCRLCYENELRENDESNYRSQSDSSSDGMSYKYEQRRRPQTDPQIAESSFIETPTSQKSPETPKIPQSSFSSLQPAICGSTPAINRCYAPIEPSDLIKQEVQAEVHLSVMSLPGADAGTPTEQLPTGSMRSLTHQTCARFDEREHSSEFCRECGCERQRSATDLCRPSVKVVSHPAYDGLLPNPTQVVFNTLQQSLAQDRLEKKKRAMHLALRSHTAPMVVTQPGGEGAQGVTRAEVQKPVSAHSRMHALIAQSIDAMYKSHPMQIQQLPVAVSGAQPTHVALSPHGDPGTAASIRSVLARTMAGNGTAGLSGPALSTTPNAAASGHSLMSPVTAAAGLPYPGITSLSSQPSLHWAEAGGGTALNGEIPSSTQQDLASGIPAGGEAVGEIALVRTTSEPLAIGGFDWRARRMMDVARNSIRGAAARLMMKLHLAGQKPLAPPLNDNLQYHVFFLYHHNDRDWVLSVMEKLESPTLGFKTCCHERDFDARTTLTQSTHYGIKNALKTVIILSPDFVSDTWNHADMQLLSEMDVILIQKDLLVILLQECDIPHILTDTAYIDANQEDWWSKLLGGLCSSDDTPMTEETNLSLSSSLVGLNPNLQSGHLLLSLKSQCRFCGKEVVDPSEVPDDLLAHGIQITPEEYHEAVSHLMSDNKFRCHVWCYNVPAAMLFFTLFLGLCLAVIPLVEARLIFHGAETGLEFVHGGIVWLCALTIYMVIIHISKRKMKDNTYKKLTFVNTILIKYNLLAGVENLGLADCNKYYLHFFYFEMGPCLAYLQELMVNMEEYSTCFQNQIAESGDVAVEIECDEEHVTSSNDRSRVLDRSTITNTTMQAQAEDLILEHSGEYINLLITKKLERPRRQRHVRDAPCLCQYVEQRVYKMIV